APTDLHPLSLHDALPISAATRASASFGASLKMEVAAVLPVSSMKKAGSARLPSALPVGTASSLIEARRCKLRCAIVLDASILSRSEEHTSELQSPCNLVC